MVPEIASSPAVLRNDESAKFNWMDNLPVQKLLDVVISIIADEYIQVVKDNPEVFTNNGGQI